MSTNDPKRTSAFARRLSVCRHTPGPADRRPVGKTAAKRKSLPTFGWASLLSCSCLRYALIRSDGPLFMSATANTGTVAQAGAARTWAPAVLACMGVVFGDIG